MLKIAFDPIYALPLPDGHRFPMKKYELLPEQLMREGTAVPENFFSPEPADEPWVLSTHAQEYWEKLMTLTLSDKEVRRIGFPLSSQLIQREVIIAGGTIACTHFAITHGIAMNIAGGTHHAFYDRGEGYCILNDQAIAANFLLQARMATRILIIDLDVHQGNGTARIFDGECRVFTFSMHGANNFPYHKEKSDLDIALPDGTDDGAYLSILKEILPKLVHQQKPDFVFYLAGVDLLATDKLGRLALSREGCKERDYLVISACRRDGIPVAVCMGGGYSEKLLDIIEAHAGTFRVVRELYF